MCLKKLLPCFLCIFFVFPVFSQDYDVKCIEKDDYLYIEFSLKNFSLQTINTKNDSFTKLSINNTVTLEEKGFPSLPFIRLHIDFQKINDIKIVNTTFYDTLLQWHLLPSYGTIYRNQDNDKLEYSYNSEYTQKQGFFPAENVILDEKISFRSRQEQPITLFPFCYNYTNKKLRIYKNISLRIRKTSKSTVALPDYEYGDLLIITPEKYDSVLQKYITWKREKGINVEVLYCDSAENVTNKISEAYNRNTNLSYVQLVGNWNDVRSSMLNDDPCFDCPTDPSLGFVAGNDFIPDLAISRFSCRNLLDLEVQIDKAITYEKLPTDISGWRERFIGIGSNGSNGDDNEKDYEHIKNIYAKLSNFTYSEHSEHYDYGTNTSSNALIASINQGASTIAYCGHGTGNYWLTGNYGGNNVQASYNIDMLPFIISVACSNGTFHNEEECFAEKWLNTQHSGAVATLMSSINQPWNPPMRGQDYFYDLLSGGYNYDTTSANGINTSEQRTHWGALVLNSFYLMLCESAQPSDIRTVKTWISFGDVCLQLRTAKPKIIKSKQQVATANSSFTTQITSEEEPIGNALVCLSQDGNYYKGFTNRLGEVNINHNLHEGKALMVVTAFNTTTIYDSIVVIPQEKAYINIENYSPQKVNIGTKSRLLIELKNWGNITADSVKLQFSTQNPNITFINSEVFLGNLQPDSIAKSQEITFIIPDEIEFGEEILLQAKIFYNDTATSKEIKIQAIQQKCYFPDTVNITHYNDSCIISWTQEQIKPITLFDSFEDANYHTEFTINSSGEIGWNYIDSDNSQTIGITNYKFLNNRQKMSFIVVNPHKIYSDNTTFFDKIHPHSGKQFIASFGASAVSTWTNDLIISPLLNFVGDIELSFYVRGSHIPNYWETMKVYYFTETNHYQIDSCTIKGNTNPDFWEEKRYILPDSAKYIAIQNNSNNKQFLCIDDIKISGNAVQEISGITIYDNEEMIASNCYNQLTINNLEQGEHCISLGIDCNIMLFDDQNYCFVTEECSAPFNVECYKNNGNDSLCWQRSENANYYEVFLSDSLIATTTNYFFVNQETENGVYSIVSKCTNGESERVLAEIITPSTAKNETNYFTIYPNPSNGLYCVDYHNNTKDLAYKVYDICGRLILEGKLVGGRDFIDIQVVKNGVYTLTLEFEEGRKSVLIIKQ